jgi:hypothetical protein
MASPRGKKKLLNEESNVFTFSGHAPLLDTSAINEEGMFENLNISGAKAPRRYNSNNNSNIEKGTTRSRAIARRLPLIVNLESPPIRHNNGASSPTRADYAFTIDEEKGEKRGRKHSKSRRRSKSKSRKSHSRTRRTSKNKVKIE